MSGEVAKGRPNARLKTSELIPTTEHTPLISPRREIEATEDADTSDLGPSPSPDPIAKVGSLSSSSATDFTTESDGHSKANQSIGFGRMVCSTIALGVLVFLIATNMSMLTTIRK